MATLNDKQREGLRRLGIDPDNAQVTPPSERSGVGNTVEDMGFAALNATIPTAGGFAGAGLGMAAGAMTGPFAPVAIPAFGLIGGLGLGFGTAKAQEAILPHIPGGQDFQNKVVSSRETSPNATFAAEFIPEIVGMRPSVRNVGKLLKGVKNFITPKKKLSDLEKDALMQAAIGGTVEAGVELGAQSLQGEGLDLGKVSFASLIGGGISGAGRGNFIKSADDIPLTPETNIPKNENVKGGVDIATTGGIPIPLGVNRPTIRKRELESLSDKQFEDMQAKNDVALGLKEEELDLREFSRKENIELAILQDEFSAIELEHYRRQQSFSSPEEIAQNVRLILSEGDRADKLKVRVGLEELKKKGVTLEQAFGASLDVFEGIAPELFKGELTKLKEFLSVKNENAITTDDVNPSSVVNNPRAVQPVMFSKLDSAEGGVHDQIPTQGGEVIVRPETVVAENIANTDPVLAESVARDNYLSDMEVGAMAPLDVEGIKSYTSANPFTSGKPLTVRDRLVNRVTKPDSNTQHLIDKGVEAWDGGGKTLDDFKDILGKDGDVIGNRIPLPVLHKVVKNMAREVEDVEDLVLPPPINSGPGNPRDLITKAIGAVGHFMSPTIEKVRRTGPVGEYMAPKFTQAIRDERKIFGKNSTPFLREVARYKRAYRITQLKGLAKMTTLNNASLPKRLKTKLDEVGQVLSDEIDAGLGGSKIKLDAEQKVLYDSFRESMLKYRKYQNEDVGLGIKETVDVDGKKVKTARFGSEDPTFYPQGLTREALNDLTLVKRFRGASAEDRRTARGIEYVKHVRPKLEALDIEAVTLGKKKKLKTSAQLDAAAESAWVKYRDSFGSLESGNKASGFGPLDKPGGLGIPPSWRNKDIVIANERYGRRAAKRLAFAKNIELDPVMRKALGIKGDLFTVNPNRGAEGEPDFLKRSQKQVYSQGEQVPRPGGGFHKMEGSQTMGSDVSDFMVEMEGKDSSNNLFFEAISGGVKSLIMGFATGGRDLANMVLIGMPHLTPETMVRLGVDGAKKAAELKLGSIKASYKAVAKSIADGMEEGVITADVGSNETTQFATGGAIETMFKFRDVANKIQGRSLFEQISRGTNFMLGKYGAFDAALALAGKRVITNNQSRKNMEAFFDEFAPEGIDWRKKYIEEGKGIIPQEDLEHIAARYVETTQGTYDHRGLPAWATSKGISPFIGLQRWGLERSITANRTIIKPMKDGNYMRAFMTLAGAAGLTPILEVGIEALNGGRRLAHAKWREIYAAAMDGDNEEPIADEVFYRVTSQLALASQFGIQMDIINNIVSARQTGRVMPVVSDTLLGYKDDVGKEVMTMLINMSEGNYDTEGAFMDDFDSILSRMNQTIRLVNKVMFPGQRKITKELNEKKEYAVFNRLYGYNNPAPLAPDIRVSNKMKKDFAKEEDLSKAATMVPGLVARAKERAGNNRDKLKSEFNKLDVANTTPVPNPRTSRTQFKDFKTFMNSVPFRDDKETAALIKESRIERRINSRKNAMTPNL